MKHEAPDAPEQTPATPPKHEVPANPDKNNATCLPPHLIGVSLYNVAEKGDVEAVKALLNTKVDCDAEEEGIDGILCRLHHIWDMKRWFDCCWRRELM